MKKAFTILLIFLLTTCTLNRTIKIGFISTLTGRMSSLGVETRNSVELGIQNINKLGGINGRMLELVIVDDENSVEKSKSRTKKLLDENIRFIISAQTSTYAESLLEIIDNKNVLTISPTMSTTLISNRDDNFIRISPTNKSQSETLSSLLKTHNRNSVAIIYDEKNLAYTKGLYDFLIDDYANKPGLSITGLPFSELGIESINNILNTIVKKRCDSILFIANSTDVALIAQQIKKNNMDLPLYSGTWAMTENLMKMGGESVEGLYIIQETVRELESDEYIKYKNAYFKNYKEYPTFISTRAYEAIRLLIWGLNNSKKIDPLNVKERILSTPEIEGIIQNYVMNKYGDVKMEHTTYIVENGQFIILK